MATTANTGPQQRSSSAATSSASSTSVDSGTPGSNGGGGGCGNNGTSGGGGGGGGSNPGSRSASPISDGRRPPHSSSTGMPTMTTMLQTLYRVIIGSWRFMMRPVRWLSDHPWLNNAASELDGLAPAVAAKATQQFSSYLRKVYLSVIEAALKATTTTTTAASSSSSPSSSSSSSKNEESGELADDVDNNNNNNGSVNNNNTNNADDVVRPWTTVGFTASVQEAIQKKALLLVYLHSPLHRESETFVRNALLPSIPASTTTNTNTPCSSSSNNNSRSSAGSTSTATTTTLGAWLAENVNHVVAVGVSIHTGQGAHLQQLLNATSFPFLALLQPKATTTSSSSGSSGGSMNLLLRAEGPRLMDLIRQQTTTMTAVSGGGGVRTENRSSLLIHLQTALSKHLHAVSENERRRLIREQEVLLRQQQDEEYLATLAADQERERQREEERKEELRKKADEAERERLALEAEQNALDAARALIRDEPPMPSSSRGASQQLQQNEKVVMIRFVLPTGAKINRRFYSSETIATLKAYVMLHFRDEHDKRQQQQQQKGGQQQQQPPAPITNIGLSTSFPRKSYDDDQDNDMTLEAAGLYPQAVLMVQDLDA